MKRIPLTFGFEALVDDADYELVSKIKWLYHPPGNGGKTGYARMSKKPGVMMHRLITSAPKGVQVDHTNRDGLDNRRDNLRLCNATQNKANCGPRQHSSQYKWVSWQDGKWYVRFKSQLFGTFDDEAEAARHADRIARRLYGEFAWQNMVEA